MMKINNKSEGQTLVIIFFVMILALGIGISISDRFIKTLRSSVRSHTSDRALAVAEAGVEGLLNKSITELNDYITFNSCGSNCSLTITNDDGQVETAVITLSRVGQTSSVYNFSLNKDQTEEILLEGYPNNTDLTVCWENVGNENASTYAVLVYGDDSNILAETYAFNSASDFKSNNFGDSVAISGYTNCFVINSKNTPRLLRVKAYYADADYFIVPAPGSTIPLQGILIRSVGTVLDTKKIVEVVKKVGNTPAGFEYVIYQKSTSSPFSN